MSDSYFSEHKRIELMKERLEVLSGVDPYVGKYYSEQYVRDNIISLTAEEQERIVVDIAGVDGNAGTPEGADGAMNMGDEFGDGGTEEPPMDEPATPDAPPADEPPAT